MFQDGIDVDSYQSIEVPRGDTDDVRPIQPYILWVSSDRLTGPFYIKIDRKLCIPVDPKEGEEAILTAVEILFKAHTVFNLQYHPYLELFFNLVECISKVKGAKPKPSVASILRILRAAGRA